MGSPLGSRPQGLVRRSGMRSKGPHSHNNLLEAVEVGAATLHTLVGAARGHNAAVAADNNLLHLHHRRHKRLTRRKIPRGKARSSVR